jgi:CRP-like cAMP-binding protein
MLEARSRNHILASLAPDGWALLQPCLQHVELPVRTVLEAPGKPIAHVYFPTAGLVSVVAAAGRDRRAEIGIIGADGFTGHAVILGDDRSPNSVYMQIEGRGVRIAADVLRTQMRKSASLHAALNKFIAAFLAQCAATALAYSSARLAARLARWLLMANDRVGGDNVTITHEFLSIMLGVRRAGVTVALHDLAKRNIIELARSHTRILDRAALREVAGEFYGVAEAEAARLTGWRPVDSSNKGALAPPDSRSDWQIGAARAV